VVALAAGQLVVVVDGEFDGAGGAVDGVFGVVGVDGGLAGVSVE
jgi:hypothetical protein